MIIDVIALTTLTLALSLREGMATGRWLHTASSSTVARHDVYFLCGESSDSHPHPALLPAGEGALKFGARALVDR